MRPIHKKLFAALAAAGLLAVSAFAEDAAPPKVGGAVPGASCAHLRSILLLPSVDLPRM